MIPAVLTCLFVIYLYRTLNAEQSPTGSSGAEPACSIGDLSTVTKRLASLEERLRQLAPRDSTREKRP